MEPINNGTVGPLAFVVVCLAVVIFMTIIIAIRNWRRKNVIRCVKCGTPCDKRTATKGYGIVDPIAAIVLPLCVGCYIGIKAHSGSTKGGVS